MLYLVWISYRFELCSAPLLVVLRDRGQELRFYRPHQLNLKAEAMLEFLKHDGWQATPPWSSAYAPGGSRCVPLSLLDRVVSSKLHETEST